MKNIYLTLMLLTCSWLSIAQTAILKGQVKTQEGKPAEFVNVILRGTNKGVVTNDAGNFEIQGIKAGNYVVQASFVGLEAVQQKVSLTSGQTLEITLTLPESAKELQEVVVNSNPSKYVTDYPSISLRLKTPLLELPQNIQVVTKQLLQDQQIFDMLEGVTRNVSGVTRLEHWDNYALLNMRGSQIAAFRNGMNVQMAWDLLPKI
jgi:iron complex outermembrane receptor protein